MWWKISVMLLAVLLIGTSALISRVDITLGIILHALLGTGGSTPTDETLQSRLEMPAGFSVGLFAADVTNARFIEFTDAGDLLVAQPRESKVSLIMRDADADGVSDGQRDLLNNLERPHSIDFFEGYLYIAESTAVGRVPFDHASGELTGDYERIITGLGDVGNHWTKTIRFGPDGLLYMSSGSTCNVCLEEDHQRATMTRYNPDGSGEQRFATGLRNSVGFDWSPFDGHLYATDNGRDLLGNDYPPCELNRVEEGRFYGWPHVNGFGDPDPDFPDDAKLAQATSPVHGFRPHNAPLGIRFISGESVPESYQDVALVALHGSWNRSSYDGYKVVSLHWEGDRIEERDFLSGFERDGDIIGRPVDVAEGPDGCLYVSDDFSMSILRVCHGIEQSNVAIATDAGPSASGLEHLDEASLADRRKQGEKLYRTRGCIGCHVVNVEAESFGLIPLRDIDSKYSVDSLRSFFRTPTPPMPPVRLAGEDEELALSAYLLSL